MQAIFTATASIISKLLYFDHCAREIIVPKCIYTNYVIHHIWWRQHIQRHTHTQSGERGEMYVWRKMVYKSNQMDVWKYLQWHYNWVSERVSPFCGTRRSNKQRQTESKYKKIHHAGISCFILFCFSFPCAKKIAYHYTCNVRARFIIIKTYIRRMIAACGLCEGDRRIESHNMSDESVCAE